MVALVEFPREMEQRVRFIEDTTPDHICEATLEKLRKGDRPEQLLAAAGLAVSRSSELPTHHHGGPVHPVAGLHASMALVNRLDGEWRYLPVIQSVALANKHIRSPDMGPAAMTEVEPVAGGGRDKEALLEAFVEALGNRKARTAECHLLTLLHIATPGRIVEAMMQIALPRNMLDDHFFLYPIYALRALDDLGWQWASVLLRPPVRYLASHPMLEPIDGFGAATIEEGVRLYQDFDAIEQLIDERELDAQHVRIHSGEDETAAIGALAERIGDVDDIRDVTGMLADALAAKLSLEGVGEALSIGGGYLFLRSHSGNPFDVHIHTGINARRYLLTLDGVSLRTKLLALFTWCYGTEVRALSSTLTWPVRAAADTLAHPPGDSQQALLDALINNIAAQPVVDLETITVPIEKLVAPDEVHQAAALAERYAALGHDAEPFFKLLGELVCRDDASEMHAYKMQQAAIEEYQTTREPYRWVHLVSAAKHAACITEMRPKTVYPRIRPLLMDRDAP